MLRQAISSKTCSGGKHGVETGLEAKDFCIEDRANVGCVVDWAVWILLAYLRLDGAQLCGGLCDGDAGFEPAESRRGCAR